jgi:hypothetical protein
MTSVESSSVQHEVLSSTSKSIDQQSMSTKLLGHSRFQEDS